MREPIIAMRLPAAESSVMSQSFVIATDNVMAAERDLISLESATVDPMAALGVLSASAMRLQLAAQQLSNMTQILSRCIAENKITIPSVKK